MVSTIIKYHISKPTMQDTLNVNDLFLYLPHLPVYLFTLLYIIPVNILCLGTMYLNLLRLIIYVDTCLNCTAEITLNKRSILKKNMRFIKKVCNTTQRSIVALIQEYCRYNPNRLDVIYGFTLQFSIFDILFYQFEDETQHHLVKTRLIYGRHFVLIAYMFL